MSRFTLGALAAAVASLSIASARAELVYGITPGGGLVTFDSATPATFTPAIAITGLTGTLNSIDFRPATGVLYGLTYVSASQEGRLYTIDTTTAAATQVGSPFTLTGTGNGLVSIDFNPVVDRLRVVTSAETNYRINPDTGALIAQDTNLAYAAGDPNAAAPTRDVLGIAYTNNVIGATSTTLYAYEFQRDQILTIGSVGGSPVSPNTGTMFTIGGLGGPSAFDGGVGFDISGVTGIAYLSFDDVPSATAQEEFYSVNLATGRATLIDDEIGVNLIDISVAPAPIPEPAALGLLPVAGLALVRRRR